MWFYFPIICYMLAGNPTNKSPNEAVIPLSLPEKEK